MKRRFKFSNYEKSNDYLQSNLQSIQGLINYQKWTSKLNFTWYNLFESTAFKTVKTLLK